MPTEIGSRHPAWLPQMWEGVESGLRIRSPWELPDESW